MKVALDFACLYVCSSSAFMTASQVLFSRYEMMFSQVSRRNRAALEVSGVLSLATAKYSRFCALVDAPQVGKFGFHLWTGGRIW